MCTGGLKLQEWTLTDDEKWGWTLHEWTVTDEIATVDIERVD